MSELKLGGRCPHCLQPQVGCLCVTTFDPAIDEEAARLLAIPMGKSSSIWRLWLGDLRDWVTARFTRRES